jgi:hypothetical protein
MSLVDNRLNKKFNKGISLTSDSSRNEFSSGNKEVCDKLSAVSPFSSIKSNSGNCKMSNRMKRKLNNAIY